MAYNLFSNTLFGQFKEDQGFEFEKSTKNFKP